MRSTCPTCCRPISIVAGKKHQYCRTCDTLVTTGRLRWRTVNGHVCFICDRVPAWTIGSVAVLAMYAFNVFN